MLLYALGAAINAFLQKICFVFQNTVDIFSLYIYLYSIYFWIYYLYIYGFMSNLFLFYLVNLAKIITNKTKVA